MSVTRRTLVLALAALPVNLRRTTRKPTGNNNVYKDRY